MVGLISSHLTWLFLLTEDLSPNPKSLSGCKAQTLLGAQQSQQGLGVEQGGLTRDGFCLL